MSDDPLAGTPRVMLAAEAMHNVSAEDIARADPVAVGILRTQLTRLIQLSDTNMSERP